jgi:hypothetical protein
VELFHRLQKYIILLQKRKITNKTGIYTVKLEINDWKPTNYTSTETANVQC